ERAELLIEGVGLERDLPGGGETRVARLGVRRADVRRLLEDRCLERVRREAGRRKAELVGGLKRRNRHLRRRDHRLEGDVERPSSGYARPELCEGARVGLSEW